jgi:uncharacterized protein YjbI with pentapeptide repeats
MAGGAATPKLPQTPSRRPAIVDEAKDLKALRAAVVDAASVGAGLWLSYLFVLLYLLIAVGSVTHRNLFLEDPVKLPFLGVDLPLVGFFVLGPGLFLIVHAYVLLHLVLLGSKVGAFHTQLEDQISDSDVRAQLRRQLPSNIFVQFLAGPREVRSGIIGLMLRGIALISLVVGPVVLLVFFQFQFLPYHPPWGVELWQRIAVIIDLALLWMLWPSISRGTVSWTVWLDLRRSTAALVRFVSALLLWTGPPDNRRRAAWRELVHAIPRVTIATAAIASVVPVLLVFTISTVPDEWLDQTFQSVPIITTMRHVLFAVETDEVTGRPHSWFSDRLVLTDQSFVDPEKLDKVEVSHSFRGRELSYAVFNRADLRKADFTGAILNQAQLKEAKLQNARFLCASAGGVWEGRCADLQDANLYLANLQGAELFGAHLQGAILHTAELQGADFESAQLQGAELFGAQLQGAKLFGAILIGADFEAAVLQGADLSLARMQGTDLEGTQLQGASLSNAVLEGAMLREAQMWRVRGKPLPFTPLSDQCDFETKPWDGGKGPQSFTEWRDNILEQIPAGRGHDEAKRRLSALDPNQEDPKDLLDPEFWKCASPKDEKWYKELAGFLADLACTTSPPYVARGLLRYGHIESIGASVAVFAERLLKGKSDPTACPAASDFTSQDWGALHRGIADASKRASGTTPLPPGKSGKDSKPLTER